MLGALGGGVGAGLQAAVSKKLISQAAAWAIGAVVDITASSASAAILHQQDFGQALVTNALTFGVTAMIGAGVGRLVRSRGAREVLAEGVDQIDDDLARAADGFVEVNGQSVPYTQLPDGNIDIEGIGVLGRGGGSDSELFYRTMKETEFARVEEAGGLVKRNSGSSELFITQDREYVESLVSRPGIAEKYPIVAEFEVQPGTAAMLEGLGATHNSAFQPFPNNPRFERGMDAVQLKLERGGVLSFGLGSSTEGLKRFNDAIIAIRRLR